jgi:hypothetical protein
MTAIRYSYYGGKCLKLLTSLPRIFANFMFYLQTMAFSSCRTRIRT